MRLTGLDEETRLLLYLALDERGSYLTTIYARESSAMTEDERFYFGPFGLSETAWAALRPLVNWLAAANENSATEPPDDIPPFPFAVLNAERFVLGAVEQVDFADGSGVRFLAYYGQDVVAPGPDSIRYIYYGLNDRGDTLIIGYIRLTASVALETDFDVLAQQFATLPPGAFDPSLTTLDEVIGSITVGGWCCADDAGDREPSRDADQPDRQFHGSRGRGFERTDQQPTAAYRPECADRHTEAAARVRTCAANGAAFLWWADGGQAQRRVLVYSWGSSHTMWKTRTTGHECADSSDRSTAWAALSAARPDW